MLISASKFHVKTGSTICKNFCELSKGIDPSFLLYLLYCLSTVVINDRTNNDSSCLQLTSFICAHPTPRAATCKCHTQGYFMLFCIYIKADTNLFCMATHNK